MEEPYSSNCHNLSLCPTTTNSSTTTTSSSTSDTHLDYDVVVILAAMICALVCALGLNSMLQCVVRCTRRTLAEPAGWVASRRLNAGIKREHVVALPISTFSSAAAAAASSPPVGCPICLSDFSDGDKIRVLPACSHRFHVACIDTWLLSHCSCPTCRNRLSAAAAAAAAAQGSEVPIEIVTSNS